MNTRLKKADERLQKVILMSMILTYCGVALIFLLSVYLLFFRLSSIEIIQKVAFVLVWQLVILGCVQLTSAILRIREEFKKNTPDQNKLLFYFGLLFVWIISNLIVYLRTDIHVVSYTIFLTAIPIVLWYYKQLIEKGHTKTGN